MKLRNTKKVLKLNEDSISSAPSKEKTLVILAKNYEKTDVKVFCSHHILFNSFTLVQIFFPWKSQFKENLKDQSGCAKAIL